MKQIVFVLFCLFIHLSVVAAPAFNREEIEFRFEPSFHDGTLVYLARLPDGKIHCSAYTLPLMVVDGAETHSKAPAKLLKEVTVSAQQFDALVKMIESEDFRTVAERTMGSGNDGVTLIFRRKAGVRSLEFRFWSPDANSLPQVLAEKFLAAARLPLRHLTVAPPKTSSETAPPAGPRSP